MLLVGAFLERGGRRRHQLSWFVAACGCGETGRVGGGDCHTGCHFYGGEKRPSEAETRSMPKSERRKGLMALCWWESCRVETLK